MSFFALLFALLIEQVRPLAYHNPVYGGVLAWTRWTSRNFDAGKSHHGWVAWTLAVAVPTLLALGIHWLLVLTLGLPFAVRGGVAVLYVTLGFRQFSHHFTGIRDALGEGDEAMARTLLARWQRVEAAELPRSEIVRHVIEHSVIAAHRHVFGVLAWYSILAALGLGPAYDPLPRAQPGESPLAGHLSDSGSTPGRQPEPAHLRSVVGLVWRSVVMWMVLLALLTLARLLG